MIWVVLMVVVVVWANWPERTTMKPHFKQHLTGEVKFIEYRARSVKTDK